MPVPLMDLAPMRAHLRERLLAAAADVLDSGRFILGPEVQAFEREAAVYVDAAHGVGVANGTDALVLALRALGVEPGDEVICPAYTFFATPEAIAAAGATPVFADIEAGGGFQLDAAAVEAAITERTRAVVAVHLYGHPAPMDALKAVCEPRGIPILEDAAQAIGARLNGGACGSLGAAATFSFFPTKNLGGFGDGGLVTTQRRGRRGPRAHPALPRLARQADVRADRRQLAARRAAGGAPARGPARARRLERRARPGGRALRGAGPRRARRAARHRARGRADLPPLRRAHRRSATRSRRR